MAKNKTFKAVITANNPPPSKAVALGLSRKGKPVELCS
jgi:hypothetical protein